MKFSVVRIKRHTRSEKGFTLIELIMAMAIMSILLTMYYSLFFTGESNMTLYMTAIKCKMRPGSP